MTQQCRIRCERGTKISQEKEKERERRKGKGKDKTAVGRINCEKEKCIHLHLSKHNTEQSFNFSDDRRNGTENYMPVSLNRLIGLFFLWLFLSW